MSIVTIKSNKRNKTAYAKNSVMSTKGRRIFGPVIIIQEAYDTKEDKKENLS